MFLRAMLCVGCLVIAACQPASETQPQTMDKPPASLKYQAFLADLAQRHIQLSYQGWLTGLTALQQAAEKSCETTELSGFNTVQQLWRNSMRDWQHIKWFKLGPIEDESGHVRVQFWPDSNRAVERGLTKVLRAESLPSSEKIANINVGAQGLPALERLLFDPQYAEVDPVKRCHLVNVVAQNLVHIASQVVNQWQSNFVEQFVQGSGSFTSTKDAVEELVSVWLTQLIVILDHKISYPLSLKAPGIPQIAESPFADFSAQSLRANIGVYRTIYTAGGGYGLDDLLTAVGQADLAKQISQAIDDAERAAENLPDSYTDALASEKGRQNLQQLTIRLRALQKLLAVDMVDALNLNLGFNALDGD